MTLLEGALVALVIIWTIIFIIGAVMFFLFVRMVKQMFDKANKILDETQTKAEEFDLPSKLVTASVIGFMAKQSVGPLIKLIGGFISRKK
jgi:preprotein translocase subunit SecY